MTESMRRKQAFFAGRAMGRNDMTKVEVPRTMKRLRPPARTHLAEQLVARWWKQLTCQSGAWNRNKIIEEVIRLLKARLKEDKQ